MSDEAIPTLSVILLTPGSFEVIRRTVGHLAAQSICREIELVIVAPSAADLCLDREAVAAFARVAVVEVGPVRRTAAGKAAGVLGATAPYVGFVEEHSWPAPGWARALVDRPREGYSVVGLTFANPNPARAVSWANFFLEYGPWMEWTPGGAREHLPGNNSAYRRDVLLECGDALPAVLDAESVLHWDLATKGHRLFLEPRARTYHLNISRTGSFLSVSFNYGWMFADARAREWTWPRRILYAAGSPAIPLVRLPRVIGDARRAGRLSLLPRVAPALLAGLVAGAVGEFLGYLVDGARARQRIFDLEFGRPAHLAPGDRVTTTVVDPPAEGR